MSEIKDTRIADMEFNKLHGDLGKLDSELNIVKLCTDGQDMSEELLGIILAPMQSMSPMAHLAGKTEFGINLCQGSSSSLSQTRHLFTVQRLLH